MVNAAVCENRPGFWRERFGAKDFGAQDFGAKLFWRAFGCTHSTSHPSDLLLPRTPDTDQPITICINGCHCSVIFQQ
jgi:hypothetical protein